MAQSTEPSRFAVLVVEGDPLLSWEAVDLAEEAGFKTYWARNADEAIVLMERHDEIRILFTDVDMPGSMDGLKLAWAIRDRWPPVVIFVTSGAVDVQPADLPSDGLFFPKPVSPGLLVHAFRSVGQRLN